MMIQRLGLGSETAFPTRPKVMLWASKPNAQTKRRQGLTTEDIRGPEVEGKQLNKEQHRHQLWGQTKFHVLLVAWPWSCWMGSHEKHDIPWVQTTVPLLSRYMVLNWLCNLFEPQFPYLQTCKQQLLSHRTTWLSSCIQESSCHSISNK